MAPDYLAPEVAAPSTPSTNGTPPAAPPSGPRLVRKEAWVDLPQAEYPGFRAKLWINYPQRFAQEISSGDQERGRAALRRIVLEHNGWCNEEGAPYPAASDPGFWAEIPDELAGVLIVLCRLEPLGLARTMAQRASQPAQPLQR